MFWGGHPLSSPLKEKTIVEITHSQGNVCICQVPKRAHLADIFFGVKNLPEMKYHVCVIHRRDLALTELLTY